MPYVTVDDFRLGQDNRSPAVVGVPGSLVTLKNAHITRGGRIQRAKKFVSKFSLPAAKTFGFHGQGGNLFTFGGFTEPAGVPAGVTYQRLAHKTDPTGTEIAEILDTDNFDGKIYAIAEYTDGEIYHFYDGVRVTSWDTVAASISSNNTVAAALKNKIDLNSLYTGTVVTNVVTIEAATAGVPFTISASAQNFGSVNDQLITLAETQVNVPVVGEVLATGTVTVTGGTDVPGTNKMTALTVDGVSVITSAVDYDVSNSVTATAIATEIGNTTSSPNYTAAAVGNVVTITAIAGTGAGPNGFVVTPIGAGDFSANSSNMSGGAASTSAVKQKYTATITGTFEVLDVFTITLDGVAFAVSGTAAGTGVTCQTFKSKIYSLVSSLLQFCAIDGPTQWGAGIGSGFINFANQDGGSETLTATGIFQGNMGVFAEDVVQVEFVDVDETANTLLHTVKSTGTPAHRSAVQFGNTDLFYLDGLSGIRSLRARDSSNSPSVDDVGSSIDTHVLDHLDTLTTAQIADAVAMIADEGRYWLAIGNRIYVFSFFSGNKISAWSFYEPGFSVKDMVRVGKKNYVRAGDTVYLYGGDAGTTFPDAAETPVTATLPFMDVKKIANFKTLQAVDQSGTNTWDMVILIDPDDLTAKTNSVALVGTTYPDGNIGVQGRTTHFAPEFTCSAAGAAELYTATIHYLLDEAG